MTGWSLPKTKVFPEDQPVKKKTGTLAGGYNFYSNKQQRL